MYIHTCPNTYTPMVTHNLRDIITKLTPFLHSHGARPVYPNRTSASVALQDVGYVRPRTGYARVLGALRIHLQRCASI